VFWAGVLPYHCNRPTLDLLGRTDARIAKGPAVAAARYWPGHAKRNWQYVVNEQRPEVLLGDMPELKQRPDYREAYCRVIGGSLEFIARKEARHKLLEPGLSLCHVENTGTLCLPCGNEWSGLGQALFDFEASDQAGWTRRGEAFGPTGVYSLSQPLPGQQQIEAAQGGALVNSFFGGDRTTGRLNSPEFILADDGLSLLVGGGKSSVHVALWVDGRKVITANGRDSEVLDRQYWDVACHKGKRARIVISDESTQPWGHILVDDVRYFHSGRACADGSQQR
jgi:hypothetical protein